MNLMGVVSAGAQLGLESLLLKPKRGLYDSVTSQAIIVPQATIRERMRDEMEITEHPVQQGANIADHAFNRPAELILECGWSDSPSGNGSLISPLIGYASAVDSGVRQLANAVEEVQATLGGIASIISALNGQSQDQMQAIYNTLLDLKNNRTLFDVYTGKRVYTNMLLKTIAVENDYKTENALFATLSIRQVIIVNTSVVSLQQNVQANPQATTSPVPKGQKQLTSAPKFVQP